MRDRFANYDSEVRHLVEQFETMQRDGTLYFFEAEELEIIIDYYLDTISENGDMGGHRALAERTNLERAITQAEKQYPDDSGIQLRKAQLLTLQGRYERSLELLLRLEREDPDDTDIQYTLGNLYSTLDRPREAIRCYLKATADGNELGMVYGNIADEYHHIGRLEEALRYYKKAIAHCDDECRSMHNLVATYDELNMNRTGVRFFRQLVESHPYNKTAWFCLGLILMNHHDTDIEPYGEENTTKKEIIEEAIEAFEYALTLDETYFDAYIYIAQCHQIIGRPAEAVKTLRESIKYATDVANVTYSIAIVYKQLKNHTTAAIYFKQATEQDPYFSEAWLNLADCCDQMGDSGTAETYYQRALGMKGECDEFWISYGDFLISHERYDEAIELLEQGLATADFAEPFNIRLAVCYFRTGLRNRLFSILIDSRGSATSVEDLLAMCPELENDPEVMNILSSEG